MLGMVSDEVKRAQEGTKDDQIARTLRPGGVLIGAEATSSLLLRLFHIGDTFVALPPSTIDTRLRAAGFADVTLEAWSRHVIFRAKRTGWFSDPTDEPRTENREPRNRKLIRQKAGH